jgi:murein tripeptide amidase MpaA
MHSPFPSALLSTILVVAGTAFPAPSAGAGAGAPLPPAPEWSGASRRLVVPSTDPWVTPAETSGFATTPSYDETIAWLRRLEAAAPQVRLVRLGTSGEGRDLWLVVASAEGATTPEELRKNGRPTVLAQAGIHAGEIDGKDAGLMLLRDLTVGRRLDLLSRTNFLFVPVLNADGHELRTALSRINQRGPENAGWRTTARNLNLNRDYTKIDAPETRAVVGALGAWQPDLYLDLHVTDGGDYQYDITYGGVGRGGWSPAIGDWLEDSLRPAADRALRDAGHIPGPLWVAAMVDGLDPLQGFVEWPSQARLSNGYGDARHVPTLLVENHSLKPYEQRVLGTYVLLEAVLRHAAADAAKLREAIAADRARREPTIALRRTMGESSVEVEVLGIDWKLRESTVSGGKWLEWTGQPRTFRAPLVKSDVVTASAARPLAYWVPPAWSEVIARLEAHGITLQRLMAPMEVTVEACRLHGVETADQPFEGRVALAGSGRDPWSGAAGGAAGAAAASGCRPEARTVRLPTGSVRIATDQPLGTLAMILLEPASPDSFLRWGFFHEILQRTEYVESYVMEPLAERLLSEDAALKAEYEAAVAADAELAADPDARLAWLYRHTEWADDRYLLYPVFVER